MAAENGICNENHKVQEQSQNIRRYFTKPSFLFCIIAFQSFLLLILYRKNSVLYITNNDQSEEYSEPMGNSDTEPQPGSGIATQRLYPLTQQFSATTPALAITNFTKFSTIATTQT